MNILDDFKVQYRTGGITQQLIFWNVGIAIPFLLLQAFAPAVFQNLLDWLSLSSVWIDAVKKPWTFITYAFLHAGFWHLLFNMIVLNFSSRLFLTYFTQKQFFGLYILGGIFAGILFVVTDLFLQNNSVLVGASGAIMAVLIAAVTYSPMSEIRLLLIGNVKLWHLGLGLFVLDLIQIPMNNTGGHIAHLGGAFFGFLYIKSLQSGTDLSKIVSSVIDYFVILFSPRKSTPFKKVHKNTSRQTITSQPKPQKDFTQQQIDDILDKISKSGYESLTKEEKEFLFKVGKE
ncbi:rhomboid family intramembrane serine protease [Flavobacterium sp. SM15]|uniref:rhomboid family protein n=1 Tax=Flavobacterium sp. SM15 TaxID=2908005 RepID=UPI001EDC61DC|nr:rhomboid family intramembrane serine protease [Flavobacterium sp. SM15]MCG2611169.1 rhomboid family intramembrane serine protease [Flavobacterium sp. SM15]